MLPARHDDDDDIYIALVQILSIQDFINKAKFVVLLIFGSNFVDSRLYK